MEFGTDARNARLSGLFRDDGSPYIFVGVQQYIFTPYNAYYDIWLVIQYKNDVGSVTVIRYDMVQ